MFWLVEAQEWIQAKSHAHLNIVDRREARGGPITGTSLVTLVHLFTWVGAQSLSVGMSRQQESMKL